jgi:phage terminase small subunit
LGAQAELRQWSESKKKPGETPFLRRARNGALVAHQLYGVVKDLGAHIVKLECLLGLNPVSRERIHAGVQGELFSDKDNSQDPWAELELPGETRQ